MDGYAFKYEDIEKSLKIIGTAFAGKPFNGELKSGECIKIMTGAIIPTGSDTVEMQERVQLNGNHILLTHETKLGSNIRLAGEDLKIDQIVLEKGRQINPADLGLIASLGIEHIEVYRKLKVAFFSTGDELVNLGNPLKEGQIYDSNRYTLFGMLSRLGVKVSDFGNVQDKPELLEKTLLEAVQNNDVVITSGGVSVGEADYMKALLSKHGQVLFWKINMKPGRPLAYGRVGTAHYFGLPGNPVATMVTFYQFVRHALLKVMGTESKPQPIFRVICSKPIKKSKGRMEFQRGILFEDNGYWKVEPIANQSSGVLSSMSVANCFIVLEESAGNCDADTLVNIQLFEGIT